MESHTLTSRLRTFDLTSTRAAWLVAGIAFGGALLLRVLLLTKLPTIQLESDTLLYNSIANTMAGPADGDITGIFYKGPGYPLFLSLIYRVSTDYEWVRLTQAVIWALSAGLAALIAARIWSFWAGLVAGVLTAQTPMLVHFVFLLTEGWLALAVTASVAVLVLLVPRRPSLGVVLYGVLLAVVAMSHAAWQFYPLFALPPLLAWVNVRRAALGAVLTIVAMATVLVPFHLAHPGQPWKFGGGGAGYGSGGAWTFYVGSRPETGGQEIPLDYDLSHGRWDAVLQAKQRGELDPIIASRLPGRPPFELDDSDYIGAAFEHLERNPIDTLGLMVKKEWDLFTRYEIPYSLGSPTLASALEALGKPFLIALVALGFGGLALLAFERRWQLLAGLTPPVIYTVLLFGPISSPELRYSFPAMHVLAVSAGFATWRMLDFVAQRRHAAAS